MDLEDLRNYLESTEYQDVKIGFGNPHSYRGYYDHVAFEPVEDTDTYEMLEAVKEAIGSTYEGYKGGEYLMEEYTECYLAYYGSSGDKINVHLMDHMLEKEFSLNGEDK